MISVIITAFREPVNLGKNGAHGDLLSFRDGDVIVADQAVERLLHPFSDPQVSAVSGRP